MTLADPKPGGWAFGEELLSSQTNAIRNELLKAIDGQDGGTYTLTADLAFDGVGDVVVAATLRVDPTGTVELVSGSALNVQSGAQIDVLSGGNLNVQSGGAINLLGTSDLNVSSEINLTGADINLDAASSIQLVGGASIDVDASSSVDLAGVINASNGSQISLASGSDITALSGSLITHNSGATNRIQPGATLELQGTQEVTGALEVHSGGDLEVQSGGSITVLDGANVGVFDSNDVVLNGASAAAFSHSMTPTWVDHVGGAPAWETPGALQWIQSQVHPVAVYRVIFPLNLTRGDTLTSITVRVNGGTGHPGLPVLPSFDLVRVTVSGTETVVGSFSDTSGDLPSYESLHSITTGAISVPVGQDPLYIRFNGESGGNSVANQLQVISIVGTHEQLFYRSLSEIV